MNTNLPHTGYALSHPFYSRWGSIFSGALVALGLGFLLQLFGLAIGLSAYHSSESGATTVAVGGVLGIIIGAIVSMGLAGFVSGFYGKFSLYHPGESFLYGFLTWSIALLLSALLILPLAQYTSTYNDTLKPQVTVSNNLPQNIMVTQHPTNATQTQATQGGTPAQTEVKMTPQALKGSSWLLFILFFIGAISSCIGAYYGMNCRLRHRNELVDPINRV